MPLFPMPLSSTFSFVLYVAARTRHREAFLSGYADRPSQRQTSRRSSTLVSPLSAPSSWVAMGINNLLSKEERRISASFEVYVLSLPLRCMRLTTPTDISTDDARGS